MKYCAIYKCLLCGEELNPEKVYEVSESDIMKAVSEILSSQKFVGHPIFCKVPMHIIHYCSNPRGCGVAQFVGFRREV